MGEARALTACASPQILGRFRPCAPSSSSQDPELPASCDAEAGRGATAPFLSVDWAVDHDTTLLQEDAAPEQRLWPYADR